MKKILLFGAGKSATVLIHYLLKNAVKEGWQLVVVDADLSLAESKIGDSPSGKAISFDILNEEKRRMEIEKADIVISLLPPTLHFLVAKDCLSFRKNLLTASYVDEQIKSLEKEIEKSGLLFLCEAGLDPGIDHMSAKKMLDEIFESGGKVYSFLSHCGGLVAPESDDNPWHYKISWNPRNVVMAGKNGATYKENNSITKLDYKEIFGAERLVTIPGYEMMAWYPNRDSIPYATLYELENCKTFIRTTLRHPDFIKGWRTIIELGLTNEEKCIETEGKTVAEFFNEIFEKTPYKTTAQFETVNKGNDIIEQLNFLGLKDDKTRINKGLCSAADVLQFLLESRLALLPQDKDLVVMMHELEFTKDERRFKRTATMLVTGENNRETAMAKTVGLPLGICTKLILNGTLKTTGLQVPVLKEIYEPVLIELENNGICFIEKEEQL